MTRELVTLRIGEPPISEKSSMGEVRLAGVAAKMLVSDVRGVTTLEDPAG